MAVKTPKDLASRRDGVTVKLQDDSGLLQETTNNEITFVEQVRPQFAFTWSIVDDCSACNGDGLVQRGEDVTVEVDVTNIGAGKAADTFTSIRNASDQNIFIEKGRFKLGEIPPGETRAAQFQLEVKKAYKGDDFGLRLAIIDEPLEEFTTDKLSIPVVAEGAPAVALEPAKQVIRLADKTEVLASADAKGRVIARLPKGAVVNQVAKGSAVARIEWGEKDRFAFVRLADVREAKGAKVVPASAVETIAFRSPAQISMNVDPTSGGTVVDTERFTLSSVVTDPQLLDVFVLVNDQKVFFKGRAAEDGDKVKFTTDFALKEGNNLVTIVARESQDFASRKSVVIRRRPIAVAQKVGVATPTESKQ